MKKILEDIRVLDLTDNVFGPFCTMMLAALGAQVIKVEPPWGNNFRISLGAIRGSSSPSFHAVNFNKKAIALNLKEPKGVEIFKKLVPLSDIVIEAFRPGVMERLGLGYDVLKELNPEIIYAALSGFGETGPYSTRASYAGIAQGISGFARQAGDEIDPNGPPRGMGGAIGDLVPALFTAMSVIAAIRFRDKTGKGQMLDNAQADDMIAINSSIVVTSLTDMFFWEMRKKFPMAWQLSGNMRVKDGWIAVAGHRPRALENLKKFMGKENVTRADMEELVSEMTREEAVETLVEIGMAVGPVYSAKEVVKDQHFIARDMFVEIEHPKAGKMIAPNFPVKFSETVAEITSPAPLLGQHTKEILMDLLEYSEEQIIQLNKNGIIVTNQIN